MSNQVFAHSESRQKADGSTDSLCLACFKTIRQKDGEKGHVCDVSYPSRRKRTTATLDTPRRRKSDVEWENFVKQ